MPKLLDNMRESLIAETKKVLVSEGFSAVSIRYIAKRCSVATGTIYNYFKSKESLIAACMLEDWGKAEEVISECVNKGSHSKEVMLTAYDCITDFCDRNAHVIRDPEAMKGFGTYFRTYHKVFVGSISKKLDVPLKRDAYHYSETLSVYIAETLIDQAVAGRGFDDFYEVWGQLIK